MYSKYYNVISKIKVDRDFKEKLILELEKNQEINIEENKVKYKNKHEVIAKIKSIILTIISIIALLISGGVAYAALGGKINGVPVLEWMGIKFSNNYVEYSEPVENQFVENEDVKITLETTVADEGFTILQFRVEINEDKISSYKTEEDIEIGWEVPFCYLSFNDPVITKGNHKYTELNGANYKIIIDGEKIWQRGISAQSFEKISETEYVVYQMWFLDKKLLNNKEQYEITLNDISIGIGEDCIPVNGSFNVKVSKEKALRNTITIVPQDDTTVKYKKMEKRIEKIYITPLQNIIKVKTTYKDVDIHDFTYVLDENFVENLSYIAFDNNNNNISSYVARTEERIIYEDGTIDEGTPGEFIFERDNFEHATYEIVEMIAIEKNENIDEFKLKIYETSAYYETIKNIMEYNINLKTNQIKSKNKDIFIYDPNKSIMTDEYKVYYKEYYGIDYE